MLRLTSLRLPIDHAPDALREAILHALKIAPSRAQEFRPSIKRGHDARKKPKIFYVYTVDARSRTRAQLLAKRASPDIQPAPDTSYKFVAACAREISPGPW